MIVGDFVEDYEAEQELPANRGSSINFVPPVVVPVINTVNSLA
jgi:hypothetical protein